DAVLALPQPYRQVVLLRYLHECPPAEIAARSGAPVATVKSQLQRGLSLLRDALQGRDPRRDWRRALVTTFALDRAPAAPVAVGGLFMAVGTKWVLAAAGALLAVAAFEWQRQGTAAPAQPARETPVASVPGEASGTTRDAVADGQRTSALAEPEEPWVEVRGRCVDLRGEPLAAISASLWREGEPENAAAVAVSAADGRFTVRRSLPAEATWWWLRLRLHGEGHCTLTHDALRGTLRGKPYEVLDIGDLTLVPAIRVQGTLRDRRGEPVARAELRVWHATIESGQSLATAETLRTGADGRFGPSRGLPPGSGLIAGEACHLAGTPVAFALDAAQPLVDLALVAVDRSELPAIAGTVVDEAGTPIEGASVHVADDTATVAADGAFRVVRGDDRFGPGPFELQVWADGFEEQFFGPFALGTTGVRLTLRRPPVLTLRVRAAADQRPVETFGFVAHQLQPRGLRFQEVENWPDGTATVADLRRGEYVVSVLPDRRDLTVVTSKPFLLERDATIALELPAAVSRRLVLADAAGRPLPGIGVELLQENGTPITVDANAADLDDNKYIEPGSPLRLQRGRTGERGELLLRGPGGRPLALRLSGPGPVQTIVQPVFLDAPDTLEHRLPALVAFRGRLVPADVVQELMHADDAVRPVALAVHAGPVPRYALTGPRVAVAADGSFASELPAGRWNVTLLWGNATLPLGEVQVSAGETAPVEIPVAALRRSTVELQLCLDGAPLAFGLVECWYGPPGRAATHWMGTRQADQHGRVRLQMFPGVLTAAVRLPPEGGLGNLGVFPAEGAIVPPGTSLALRIDVHPVAVEIAVRTPSGDPAIDVPLRLLGTGVRGPDLRATDAAGIARGRGVDAGRYTVLTVPRSFGSDLTTIPRDAWFAVGTIEVRARGDGTKHEITLPREWDR
ncbi:MAG TPA: carboxypeptidase regulatory-like domain-containing protein, partial [Planctomycetota bacterium]|nr:carboxypeptidase regulatory-like domain-containing protein [Planctomycetota bacterium]